MKSDLQFKEDSKLIHKYLNEIRKGLNTHTKATNKYLHGLKNALYDYAESSGDRCITMEEIIENLENLESVLINITQNTVQNTIPIKRSYLPSL